MSPTTEPPDLQVSGHSHVCQFAFIRMRPRGTPGGLHLKEPLNDQELLVGAPLWAQAGSEATRYVREILSEGGLSELVEALEAWMNAIPGGLDQIDSDFDLVYEPHVDELDDQLYDLLMREGDGYAARYLAWYRSQH